MKITLYTVANCQFSKQEKDYLASKSLSYDEKNLETNRDFLTEMLAVSNNFAGTPVTKIEKDDGQIVVLKGFTQSEFDQALNVSPAVPPPDVTTTLPMSEMNAKIDIPVPAAPQPVSPPPVPEPPAVQPPVVEPPATPPPAPTINPVINPIQPIEAPPAPQPESVASPSPANVAQDPLNNVLSSLKNKVEEAGLTQAPPPPAGNLPNIPDFNG